MDPQALEQLLSQKFGNLPNEREFAYSLFHGLALLFISRFMRNVRLWTNEQYTIERASFGIENGSAFVCFTRLNLKIRAFYNIHDNCGAYDVVRGEEECSIVTWTYIQRMMLNILQESLRDDN